MAEHIPGCTPRKRSSVCLGRTYECPGCEREVGWCNGAADELGELCDECAADVWKARKEQSNG